jgi:adenine phosphoribosyltransferase
MTLPINCEPLKSCPHRARLSQAGNSVLRHYDAAEGQGRLCQLIDAFAQYYIGKEIDLVLGIEARGFIFGPALAYRLNAGFVPVRKPKKLPRRRRLG